ncbi:hypothetical protein [Bradyrhizobium sp. C9]|uniref:hypothetical protein n=1 Tax=Bradyrhizobium sp. C9 TaxID=142585 RepID=UPI001FE15FA7|nr:hypothetical protein [Bradyrhizobium sp. C9]
MLSTVANTAFSSATRCCATVSVSARAGAKESAKAVRAAGNIEIRIGNIRLVMEVVTSRAGSSLIFAAGAEVLILLNG